MVLVDEPAALLAIVGRHPRTLAGQVVGLTYARAYRLTRALLGSGPPRAPVRGRFRRLADELSDRDQAVLHAALTDPDSEVVTVIDPRPTIRTAAAIQNTYPLSLLQAETLAAAVVSDWPVRFADPASATDAVRVAVTDLGLDLAIVDT